MAEVKITAEVKTYEVNGVVSEGRALLPPLVVSSHRNYGDRVVVEFGDQSVTVLGDDLGRAARKAMTRG